MLTSTKLCFTLYQNFNKQRCSVQRSNIHALLPLLAVLFVQWSFLLFSAKQFQVNQGEMIFHIQAFFFFPQADLKKKSVVWYPVTLTLLFGSAVVHIRASNLTFLFAVLQMRGVIYICFSCQLGRT